MERSDISDLTVFLAIADSLSFRVAADRMGVTASALSHTVRQLEARLGVRLFNRTTRNVALTEAGARLRERLLPAFDAISGALQDLDERRERPVGLLRLFVPQFAAMVALAPVWVRFMASYPDVQLELAVDPRMSDIVAESFDAGIAPRARVAADMVAIRVVGPLKLLVVGAPSYLATHGTPEHPDDLLHHECVRQRLAHDRKIFPWAFAKDGFAKEMPVTGRLISDDADISIRAALDGLGLAYVSEARVLPLLQSGQLVPVLADWCPDFDGLYIYYPGHRHVPSALRALIDMIRAPEPRPA